MFDDSRLVRDVSLAECMEVQSRVPSPNVGKVQRNAETEEEQEGHTKVHHDTKDESDPQCDSVSSREAASVQLKAKKNQDVSLDKGLSKAASHYAITHAIYGSSMVKCYNLGHSAATQIFSDREQA